MITNGLELNLSTKSCQNLDSDGEYQVEETHCRDRLQECSTWGGECVWGSRERCGMRRVRPGGTNLRLETADNLYRCCQSARFPSSSKTVCLKEKENPA